MDVIIPVKNNSETFLNTYQMVINAATFGIRCLVILDNFNVNEISKFSKNIKHEIDSDFVVIKTGTYGAPGLARNAGLEISSSDWVTFWDADDFPNLVNITNALNKYGEQQVPIIGQYRINSSTIISKSMIDVATNPGLWRIIFPQKSLRSLRFNENKWGEDQLFILQTGLFAMKAIIVSDCFYDYKVDNKKQLTQNNPLVNDAFKTLVHIYNHDSNQLNSNILFQLILVIRLSITILKRFSFIEKKMTTTWWLFKIHFMLSLKFKRQYAIASREVLMRLIKLQ